MADVTLAVKINTEALDAAIAKAEKLVILIEKAKSLAGDLASSMGDLKLDVKF